MQDKPQSIGLPDIEKYKDTNIYDEVKNTLKITETSSEYGYDIGKVPTYQYWKNGQLVDAGVYANDSFIKDENTSKILMDKSYFNGTKQTKYTNVNLLEQVNSLENIEVSIKSDGSYYLDIKKEAEFHDPLLKAFLSYYCKYLFKI